MHEIKGEIRFSSKYIVPIMHACMHAWYEEKQSALSQMLWIYFVATMKQECFTVKRFTKHSLITLMLSLKHLSSSLIY